MLKGNELFTITEDQFFCYSRCPAEYDMKYNKRIGMTDKVAVKDILLKAANYFYITLMQGQMPKLSTLISKYEKLYMKNQEFITETAFKEGLFLLRNFYDYAIDAQLSVIDLGSVYSIQAGEIVLKGMTDPIAINKNKKLELFIANFSNKKVDKLTNDMKLKHSFDMYALNNEDSTVSAIKNVHIKSKTIETSFRSDNDYNRALTAIEGVGKGIKNGIFYPRESVFCSSCSYRYHCKAWEVNKNDY